MSFDTGRVWLRRFTVCSDVVTLYPPPTA